MSFTKKTWLFFTITSLFFNPFLNAWRKSKKNLQMQQSTNNILDKPTKKIIFDSNVLFQESQTGFAQKLGYGTLASYTLTHWRNPGHRCLDMLNTISTQETDKLPYSLSIKGRSLPNCLVELQAGKKTCVQAQEEIMNAIEQLNKNNFFSSIKEKNLMISIMNIILDPEKITSVIEPIKPMISLVQKLKTSGCQLYLSATVPQELYEAFHKKHNSIIELFDGTIISAHIKAIKTDPAMLHHFMKIHKCEPKDCIIIDDLKDSIKTAQNLGMEGILFDKISTTIQKLKNCGVTV